MGNRPEADSRRRGPGRGLRRGGAGALITLLVLGLAACRSQPRFTVEPLPVYDAAFERASGWVGGDGAYTADLGGGRVLWLFGDSLLGRVEGGRRADLDLVHNAAAVQRGGAPTREGLAFFHGTRPDGRPAALFRPAEGAGWLWPYHGVRTPQGLFLFLLQVEPAEGPAGFGFKLAATWLARVADPDAPPDRWTLLQRKIPWSSERRVFGSSVLVRGGECYIYGTVDAAAGGITVKHLVLARAPLDRLEDFGAWRFFADGEWVAEAERAGRIAAPVAGEFSVGFQPGLGRYALVYTDGGISPDILLRLAPRPEGPWGEPERLFSCPEAGWDPRIFCYAAKGHPELAAGPDDLVVTYVANAADLALLESDARLYRPRFLRVAFRPATRRD